MTTFHLPDLSKDAQERIDQALAQTKDRALRRRLYSAAPYSVRLERKPDPETGRMSTAFEPIRGCTWWNPRPEQKKEALQHSFDVMAWEYMTSRHAADFERLIAPISEKVAIAFAVDVSALDERKQHWAAEYQGRVELGIDGATIPIPKRIDPKKAAEFGRFQIEFTKLVGLEPHQLGNLDVVIELEALFGDFGQRSITSDRRDFATLRRQFEQLARRTVAALGFAVTEPAKAVNLWLDILKQESHHFEEWHIRHLCLASAEFCRELETRAMEAQVGDPPSPQALKIGTEGEAPAQRSARRRAVVDPIFLSKEPWRSATNPLALLITKSGVPKTIVYEYYNGNRLWISFRNGEAIADELGIDLKMLPDVKPESHSQPFPRKSRVAVGTKR